MVGSAFVFLNNTVVAAWPLAMGGLNRPARSEMSNGVADPSLQMAIGTLFGVPRDFSLTLAVADSVCASVAENMVLLLCRLVDCSLSILCAQVLLTQPSPSCSSSLSLSCSCLAFGPTTV